MKLPIPCYEKNVFALLVIFSEYFSFFTLRYYAVCIYAWRGGRSIYIYIYIFVAIRLRHNFRQGGSGG